MISIQFAASDMMALLPAVMFTIGACVLLLSEVFLESGLRHYQAGVCIATCVHTLADSCLPTRAAPGNLHHT